MSKNQLSRTEKVEPQVSIEENLEPAQVISQNPQGG